MGPESFWRGGMWIFPLLMIIIMLVIVCSVFVKRGFRPPWQDSDYSSKTVGGLETALDILKKRYARGEISKDEFEQMKQDLQ